MKLFTPIIKLIVLLCVATVGLQAQSGTVYFDFESNGVMSNGDIGVANFPVTATDANGTSATTLTDINGNYNFNLPGCVGPVRLLFDINAYNATLPSTFNHIFESFASVGGGGTGNGSTTSVTFETCAATGINFGVMHPDDYCELEPTVVTTCYVNGDPLTANQGGTGPNLWAGDPSAFLSFNYNVGTAGADYSTYPPGNGGSMPMTLAQNFAVGATWGVAYDKYSQQTFTSAVVKRHAGLGPLGLGGIYLVSNAGNNVVTNYVDLIGCGDNLGAIGSNIARGLGADKTQPNNDVATYEQVGRRGLGDIDISTDGTELWTVNLNFAALQLIKIPIRNAMGGALIANPCPGIMRFNIPTPCGNTSNTRPWAVKYYRGKVYVGAVCEDASNAFVFEFDPNANTWTTVLTYGLNYPNKGCSSGGAGCGWNPWCDTFCSDAPPNAIYSQPILSDIEFDGQGSMILGFMDRTGNQSGLANFFQVGVLGSGVSGGDIRYIYNDNGVFVPESNNNLVDAGNNIIRTGSGTGLATSGTEFFNDSGHSSHQESAQGGLAINLSAGQVLSNAVDPVQGIINAGGVEWFNLVSGGNARGYSIYFNGGPGTFGKANGIGDLELQCGFAPLEIGNYVWNDIDADGEQDPGEPGIAGVTVLLFKGGVMVGITTTAADGTYYFNDNNVMGGLLPNMAYEVRIPAGQFGAGMPLDNFALTLTDVTNDLVDNDGTYNGAGDVVIPVTTGNLGENNHSLDYGFVFCNIMATASNDGPITCDMPIVTVTVVDDAMPGTYAWTGPNGFGSTLQTFNTSTPGQYCVTVTDAITRCTASSCTTVDINITPPDLDIPDPGPITCDDPTRQLCANTMVPNAEYTWNGPGVVDVTTMCITVSMPGTYTVVVRDPVNGCTSTASVTVVENTTPPDADPFNDGPLTCTTLMVTVGVNTNVANAQFSWTGPGGFTSNLQTFMTGVPGVYTVIVEDPVNGCTTTAMTEVLQDIAVPDVTATNDGPITCDMPIVTVSAMSMTAVTYSWEGPNMFTSTLQSFNTSDPGLYSVTVTNPINGCTNTASTMVVEDTAVPDLDVPNPGPITCDDPTRELCAITTVPNAEYTWNGPGIVDVMTMCITVSQPGTYTVSVRNPVNGCISTTSITIVEDTAVPDADASNTGPLTCTVLMVSVDASTNVANAEFTWTGPNNFSSMDQSFMTGIPGTYTVVIENPVNGCTNTASTEVLQDITIPDVDASNNGPITCDMPIVTVTAASNTAVTYSWTGPNNFTSTLQSFNTNDPGVYTIVVTNPINGCTNSDMTTVIEDTTPPDLDVPNPGPITCDDPTREICANTMVANAEYTWTGPNNFMANTMCITISTPGVYTVSVRNPVNGCITTQSVTMVEDTVIPDADASNDGPLTCVVLSVTVGASTNVFNAEFSWTGPGGFTSMDQSFMTSVPGIYTVVIENPVNGCTNTATTEVLQNIVIPDIDAENNGPITCDMPIVTVSAITMTNVTYSWSGPGMFGSTLQSFNTNNPGVYTVTVTDPVNGCTNTASTTVVEDTEAPDLNVVNPGPITCDNPTRQICAVTMVPNAEYSWTGPGGFISDLMCITISVPGTYSVTVRNPVNGCTTTADVTIIEDTLEPEAMAFNDGPITCSEPQITVGVNTNITNAQFSWTGPGGFTATTQTFMTSTPGTYTVIVENPVNGCTSTSSTTVLEDTDAPDVTLSHDGPITCNQFFVNVCASSTVQGAQYSWLLPGGGSSNLPCVLTTDPGTYRVTVTDPSNGCTTVDEIELEENTDIPEFEFVGDPVLNCDNITQQICVTPFDLGQFSYEWESNTGPLADDVECHVITQASNISVTVTDNATGCTGERQITVTEDFQEPQAKLAAPDGISIDCEGTEITIMVMATMGGIDVDDYLIVWGNDDPILVPADASSFLTNVPGIYTATVIDETNGCSIDLEIEIEEDPCGSIGNFVWIDTNYDGIQDMGEPGVGGVIIFLMDDMGMVWSTMTDANGFYEFTGLPEGNYKITTVPPAGFGFTQQMTGTPANDSNIDPATGMSPFFPLGPGQMRDDIDVGLFEPAAIGDFVWEDTDGDGVQDPGELGIPGVTVKLTDGMGGVVFDIFGNQIMPQTTNGAGGYVFNNLGAGTYVVMFVPLPGYNFTGQDATGGPGQALDSGDDSDADPVTGMSHPVTVSSGDMVFDVDAGMTQGLSLGSTVWDDVDNDGMFDLGENGIPGVVLSLWIDTNGDNIPDTDTGLNQTTDINGDYLFAGLSPGDYIVEVDASNCAPGGALFNYGTSTGNDPAPDPDNNVNNDDNGYDLGGLIVSQTVTLTVGGEPTNDGDTNANTNLSVDFGFFEYATLGDYVWNDTNANGSQDPGEPGINMATVHIYIDANGDGVPDSMVPFMTEMTGVNPNTMANGYYQFTNLPPNNYVVEFITPAGLVPSPQDNTIDTNDSDANTGTGLTASIPVTAGSSNQDVDAGFYEGNTLGNFVWEEALGAVPNGIFDPMESGIAGATVTLYHDVMGTFVPYPTPPVVTGANGAYQFTNLPAGDYQVHFTPPTGYALTVANQGLDNTIDSDPDPNTGFTSEIYTMTAGTNNQTADAGVFLELPIELLDFSATYNASSTNVDITWKTATEINNDYFIVERSTDGFNYEEIAQVDGAGNSSSTLSYMAVDADVTVGTYYYRLVQVDFNGSVSYSDVETVVIGESGTKVEVGVNVYPNPATNRVTFDINSSSEALIDVQLYTVDGKLMNNLVYDQRVSENGTIVTMEVSAMPRGMYMARVAIDNKVFTKKLFIVD